MLHNGLILAVSYILCGVTDAVKWGGRVMGVKDEMLYRIRRMTSEILIDKDNN